MRLPETDHDGPSSGAPGVSAQAGPSSLNGSVDGLVATNGHKNGFTPLANGNSGIGAVMGNGIAKHGKSIAKVNLPGTTLYDDSFVNREEFVRLVIQTLRDVGYAYVLSVLQNMQLFADPLTNRESAATLEAESGYTLELPEVSQFRQYILDGMWAKAEAVLGRLGLHETEGLLV